MESSPARLAVQGAPQGHAEHRYRGRRWLRRALFFAVVGLLLYLGRFAILRGLAEIGRAHV